MSPPHTKKFPIQSGSPVNGRSFFAHFAKNLLRFFGNGLVFSFGDTLGYDVQRYNARILFVYIISGIINKAIKLTQQNSKTLPPPSPFFLKLTRKRGMLRQSADLFSLFRKCSSK